MEGLIASKKSVGVCWGGGEKCAKGQKCNRGAFHGLPRMETENIGIIYIPVYEKKNLASFLTVVSWDASLQVAHGDPLE